MSLQSNQKESLVYGTKDSHDELFSILSEVDSFCRENNINYSLSGGTLIGAIRHKGFIPWDDDADLMFDRKNYQKFLKLVNQKMSNSYKIIGKIWVKRLSKIENPLANEEKQCVDLFVFDSVPKNQFVARTKVFLLKTLQGMIKSKVDLSEYSLKNKILILGTRILGIFFPLKVKQQIYNRIQQIGDKSDSKFINVFNTYFDQVDKLQFPKKIMDSYCDVEFCGKNFMAIKDYHTYLSILYGDYMTPPDMSNRDSKHSSRGGVSTTRKS